MAAEKWRAYLVELFHDVDTASGRPCVEEFKKAIGKMHGSCGIDQWSHFELKTISCCDHALNMVQRCMKMWEDLSLTPTVLQHAKICFAPKAKSRTTPRSLANCGLFVCFLRGGELGLLG